MRNLHFTMNMFNMSCVRIICQIKIKISSETEHISFVYLLSDTSFAGNSGVNTVIELFP